jgi:hypothetical protein
MAKAHGGEEERGSLDPGRQNVIDALMEHFANDRFGVEEFERRLDLANAATSTTELRAILSDLPGGGTLPAAPGQNPVTELAPRPSYSALPAGQVQDTESVVAVMGGSSRRGHWRPARKNHVVAIMGGIELDFREAAFGPGVTEVQVWTLWGGVEIVVPPGVNVESRGVAFLGGFDHAGDAAGIPDPSAPTLRITGLAVMAGVDISVRHAGESARDARRRRRLRHRDERLRLRDGE